MLFIYWSIIPCFLEQIWFNLCKNTFLTPKRFFFLSCIVCMWLPRLTDNRHCTKSYTGVARFIFTCVFVTGSIADIYLTEGVAYQCGRFLGRQNYFIFSRDAFQCIDDEGTGFVRSEELLDLLMSQGNTIPLKEAHELVKYADPFVWMMRVKYSRLHVCHFIHIIPFHIYFFNWYCPKSFTHPRDYRGYNMTRRTGPTLANIISWSVFIVEGLPT